MTKSCCETVVWLAAEWWPGHSLMSVSLPPWVNIWNFHTINKVICIKKLGSTIHSLFYTVRILIIM